MPSRRDFLKREAASSLSMPAALAKPNSLIHGVQIGVQSNSFSDRSLDEALVAMAEIGFSECELWQGHVEAKPTLGITELRKWREVTPASYFHEIAASSSRRGSGSTGRLPIPPRISPMRKSSEDCR